MFSLMFKLVTLFSSWLNCNNFVICSGSNQAMKRQKRILLSKIGGYMMSSEVMLESTWQWMHLKRRANSLKVGYLFDFAKIFSNLLA